MTMTAWLKKPSTERLVYLGMAAMSIVSLVYAIIVGERTNTLAECQIAYGNGFADALDARADAGIVKDETEDALWKTMHRGLTAPDPNIRAFFTTQLDDYLKAREAVRKAQKENPIKAPRDLCTK